MISSPPADRALFDRVAVAALKAYGVHADQLRGPRRLALIAEARFSAMGACVDEGLGVTHVGRLFGGRVHGAVIHALHWRANLLPYDRKALARHARFKTLLVGEKPPAPGEVGSAMENFLQELAACDHLDDYQMLRDRVRRFLEGRNAP